MTDHDKIRIARALLARRRVWIDADKIRIERDGILVPISWSRAAAMVRKPVAKEWRVRRAEYLRAVGRIA